MRPRWKVIVELAIAIFFAFVGINLFLNSVHGDLLWDAFPAWVGAIVGLVITFGSMARIHEHWDEL